MIGEKYQLAPGSEISLTAHLPGGGRLMQIFVKVPNDGTITLDVKDEDSIESLKQQIFKKISMPVSWQRLNFHNDDLEDHKTLIDYQIKNNSSLQLLMRMGGGMEEFWDKLKEGNPPREVGLDALRVSTLGVSSAASSGGPPPHYIKLQINPHVESFSIEADSSDKIKEVQQQIRSYTGIVGRRQRLYVGTRQLCAKDTLSMSRLKDGDTIDVFPDTMLRKKMYGLMSDEPCVKKGQEDDRDDSTKTGDDEDNDEEDEQDEEEDEDSDEELLMKIFVMTETGKRITITAEESTSIHTLKVQVKHQIGTATKRQKLVFEEQEMFDDMKVSDYGIRNESTLRMVLALSGAAQKRSVAATAMISREDLMLLVKAKATAKNEVVKASVGVVQGIWENVEMLLRDNSDNKIQAFINQLDLEKVSSLKDALEALASTHTERVAGCLTGFMLTDWVRLSTNVKVMEAGKCALQYAVEFLYTKEFYNERKGLFDFAKFKTMINDRRRPPLCLSLGASRKLLRQRSPSFCGSGRQGLDQGFWGDGKNACRKCRGSLRQSSRIIATSSKRLSKSVSSPTRSLLERSRILDTWRKDFGQCPLHACGRAWRPLPQGLGEPRQASRRPQVP